MDNNNVFQDRTMESILLRYTRLMQVPEENGVCLQGHLKAKKDYYHISLHLPNYPNLRDFKLLVRDGIYLKKLTEHSPGFCDSWKIEEILENVPEFFKAFKARDKEVVPLESDTENMKAVSEESDVFDFYGEIATLYRPDFYSVMLNKTCSLIRFCNFLTNDQHYLEVELPSLKVRSQSLPDCIEATKLLSECETLTRIVEQFQKYIEELQPFYDSFIGIDELCYVVQPAEPTTKHNYRLFVLRKRVFLKLVITDPFAPMASMTVHIIGPTYEVEPLRRIYGEGLKDWDCDIDIQKNLLRIFNLCYFPMAPETENDEEEQDFCNICYSYRLESNDHGGCDVPIVSCDNPQCTLIFHDSCLLQWFSQLVDKVSFLNVSFINCPFCKAKVSTSFQELLSN